MDVYETLLIIQFSSIMMLLFMCACITKNWTRPLHDIGKIGVRAEIVRCRGSQFDPEIADVMISMIDDDTEYRMHEVRGEHL